MRSLFDMLGVCRLPWVELGLSERHYERFYNYVTGGQVSLEELLRRSDDVYDLTRLINTRLGINSEPKSPPFSKDKPLNSRNRLPTKLNPSMEAVRSIC